MMFRLFAATAAFVVATLIASADEPKWIRIVHKESGKVLGIHEDNPNAGGKTVLVKEDSSEFQQWKIEKAGEYLKIINRKTGLVLDVHEASNDENASIIQWDDKAEENDNQRWSWDGDGKSRRLKAKGSGLVLDISDNDMVIQKKADEKSKTQLWDVVEVKK